MAAVLVDGRDHVLANVDVVEPIGPGPSEAERLGRLQLAIRDETIDDIRAPSTLNPRADAW